MPIISSSRVALQSLRSGVPTTHSAIYIYHVDCVIHDGVYEQLKSPARRRPRRALIVVYPTGRALPNRLNVAECALVPRIELSTEMNAPSLPAVGGMLIESARACEALRAENFPSNSPEQLGLGTQPRGKSFRTSMLRVRLRRNGGLTWMMVSSCSTRMSFRGFPLEMPV